MLPFERFKKAVRDALPKTSRSDRPPPSSQKADTLLAAGEFAEAEALLLDSVDSLKSQPSAKRRYSRALLQLATAQWKQNKGAEAKANAEAAYELLSNANQAAEFNECLELRGNIAFDFENDAASAASWFERSLEGKEQNSARDADAIARICRRLASALSKSGDHERAKVTTTRALDALSNAHGPEDLRVGECLLDVGRCETALGNTGAAMEAVDRALKIYETRCGSDSEEVAKVLQEMAKICQSSGDLEKALACYDRALKMRERQLGGKTTDLAQLLVNLGSVQSLLGRYGPAVEALQQAVMRLEGRNDDSLGSALDSLANAYVGFGRFEDAVTCVRRSRTIWESAPDQYQQALQVNGDMLRDIAEYLPYQRRITLGLATVLTGASPDRKRAPAPWDLPEQVPARRERPPIEGAELPLDQMVMIAGEDTQAIFVQGPVGIVQGYDPPAATSTPGVEVTLLHPDGSVANPAEALQNGPMHVTVVVDKNGATVNSGPAELNGWDELSFEFLAIN